MPSLWNELRSHSWHTSRQGQKNVLPSGPEVFCTRNKVLQHCSTVAPVCSKDSSVPPAIASTLTLSKTGKVALSIIISQKIRKKHVDPIISKNMLKNCEITRFWFCLIFLVPRLWYGQRIKALEDQAISSHWARHMFVEMFLTWLGIDYWVQISAVEKNKGLLKDSWWSWFMIYIDLLWFIMIYPYFIPFFLMFLAVSRDGIQRLLLWAQEWRNSSQIFENFKMWGQDQSSGGVKQRCSPWDFDMIGLHECGMSGCCEACQTVQN